MLKVDGLITGFRSDHKRGKVVITIEAYGYQVGDEVVKKLGVMARTEMPLTVGFDKRQGELDLGGSA